MYNGSFIYFCFIFLCDKLTSNDILYKVMQEVTFSTDQSAISPQNIEVQCSRNYALFYPQMYHCSLSQGSPTTLNINSQVFPFFPDVWKPCHHHLRCDRCMNIYEIEKKLIRQKTVYLFINANINKNRSA
jgi:hypothetical protein